MSRFVGYGGYRHVTGTGKKAETGGNMNDTKREWIKTSDRLPPLGKAVLVEDRYGCCEVRAIYREGKKAWYDNFASNPVELEEYPFWSEIEQDLEHVTEPPRYEDFTRNKHSSIKKPGRREKLREAVNWDDIDWSQIPQKKAHFIYNEARTVMRELTENINALNEKSRHSLMLFIPLLAVSSFSLMSRWETLTGSFKIGGFLYLLGLSVSNGFTLAALWPRRLYHSASDPAVYLTGSCYQKSYTAMIRGKIILITEHLEHNEQVIKKRGLYLRLSLISISLTLPVALVLFLTPVFF